MLGLGPTALSIFIISCIPFMLASSVLSAEHSPTVSTAKYKTPSYTKICTLDKYIPVSTSSKPEFPAAGLVSPYLTKYLPF